MKRFPPESLSANLLRENLNSRLRPCSARERELIATCQIVPGVPSKVIDVVDEIASQSDIDVRRNANPSQTLVTLGRTCDCSRQVADASFLCGSYAYEKVNTAGRYVRAACHTRP